MRLSGGRTVTLPPSPMLPGVAGGFLRILALGHLMMSALYLWSQPRGFTVWSPGFLEHQIHVPALFAVSLAAFLGSLLNFRVLLLGIGILTGFWITVITVTVVTGSTIFAYALLLLLGGATTVFGLASKFSRLHEENVWRLRASLIPGMVFGTFFMIALWSPQATTKPAGMINPLPSSLEPKTSFAAGDIKIYFDSSRFLVTHQDASLIRRPVQAIQGRF